MIEAQVGQTPVNNPATRAGSDPWLTQQVPHTFTETTMVNDFDLQSLLRQLDGARRHYGANSYMGHRISNQIGRIRFRELVRGPHRKRLDAEIGKSADGMARLAATWMQSPDTTKAA